METKNTNAKQEPSLATFETTRTVGFGGGDTIQAATYTTASSSGKRAPAPAETSGSAEKSREERYDLYS